MQEELLKANIESAAAKIRGKKLCTKAQAGPTTSCRRKCQTTRVKPQRFIQTCCPKHVWMGGGGPVCVCVGGYVWVCVSDRRREGDEFMLFYSTSPFCALSKKTGFAAKWVFIWMEREKKDKKRSIRSKATKWKHTTINQQEVCSFSCQWKGFLFWESLLYVHACGVFLLLLFFSSLLTIALIQGVFLVLVQRQTSGQTIGEKSDL